MKALVAAIALLTAHVGSPDTYFEGSAGPYPVRVIGDVVEVELSSVAASA